MDKIPPKDSDEAALRLLYGRRNRLLQKHGFATYADYRASHWHAHIRDYVMARDRYKCRVCGGKANQAHHVVYDEETLFSQPTGPGKVPRVIATCSTCHHALHYRDDGSRISDLEARARALAGLVTAKAERRAARRAKKRSGKRRKGKKKKPAQAPKP